MEKTLRLSDFSIDGRNAAREIVRGYTDDTNWNGWANIFLTLDQLTSWLNGQDCTAITARSNGTVKAMFKDTGEFEEFLPENINGETLYSMNGYCFIELGNEEEDLG